MAQSVNAGEFGLKQGMKATPIVVSDAWADTPFFAAGLESDSENLLAWAIGQTLVGYVRGLRRTKNDIESKQRDYGVFETVDGKKFRAYTPGQLKSNLASIEDGVLIAMTYNGKKLVEKLGRELHDFTLSKVE